MLEITNMKKTNFWFVVLGPFVSAVVAFAIAAAMMSEPGINSGKEPCAKIGISVR
jgi:hypothetical protein